MARRLRVVLIHHPTVALRLSRFGSEFSQFGASGIYLGNVYRRIIPQSLVQVAAILERQLSAEVQIVDLRILDPDREELDKGLDWDGLLVQTWRVGAPFAAADSAVESADWVGISSHFTFESGIVASLIAHVKRVKPSIRVAVGGADVRARASDYIQMGADLAFRGDFDPEQLREDGELPRIVPEYRYPFTELNRPAFHLLDHLQEYTDSHDGRVPESVSTPVAFAYFTRGCPRECDFCESRRTKFEMLPLKESIELLECYRRAGIQTINFSDDNLLLRAATPFGRAEFLTLLREMRDLGFAWEFPNGLEIGRFVRDDGNLDEELLEAVLSNRYDASIRRLVGAYRLYVPIETFERRALLRKLKPKQDQDKVIQWIASSSLKEVNFGVVLLPEATNATFAALKQGYRDIQEILSKGSIKARYGIFHLIPISLHRGMNTKRSVHEFPEGWNFYFPVYDGSTFTGRELFEYRLRVMREIDPANFESLKQGRYTYAPATARGTVQHGNVA